MKVAITGASGFIGYNLSQHVSAAGHDVIAVVRSHEKAGYLRKLGIEVRLGDITDPDALLAAFQGIENVIHLAALFNNPEASWEDFQRVNVEGTRNVLEASMRCGVRRVVHCSTVGVATSGPRPYSERTPYSPPNDKYEKTKCEAEVLALDFYREHGLPVVVVRPAQVYGPGDRSKAKFYKMVKRGIIVNPGSTMRHMIYVDDLCRAIETAMLSHKAVGEVFIVGGEKAIPLKELIVIVAQELGVPLPRILIPATPVRWLCIVTESLCNMLHVRPPLFRRSMDFFTKSVVFEVEKAHMSLGFRGQIDVPTGVSRTALWYRENKLL